MKTLTQLQQEAIPCQSCKSNDTVKQGISNHHNGTGVYYMYCNSCKKEWNKLFKTSK